MLADENNQIIIDNKEKITIWEGYIKELLYQDRVTNMNKNSDHLIKPLITKAEMEEAIHNSKNNKATGPDKIPLEILKILDERGIEALHKIFNIVYETGQYPQQLLNSTFFPLPKKK